jgi:hypothetical protein
VRSLIDSLFGLGVICAPPFDVEPRRPADRVRRGRRIPPEFAGRLAVVGGDVVAASRTRFKNGVITRGRSARTGSIRYAAAYSTDNGTPSRVAGNPVSAAAMSPSSRMLR